MEDEHPIVFFRPGSGRKAGGAEWTDWRCVNGHLLAKVIVDGEKVTVSIRCRNCKHTEERVLNNVTRDN